jgi:hypothetical protein
MAVLVVVPQQLTTRVREGWVPLGKVLMAATV